MHQFKRSRIKRILLTIVTILVAIPIFLVVTTYPHIVGIIGLVIGIYLIIGLLSGTYDDLS